MRRLLLAEQYLTLEKKATSNQIKHAKSPILNDNQIFWVEK